MSQENLDLIRSLYAFADLNVIDADPDLTAEAFRDGLDQDFEIRLPNDYPEGEPVFQGREGIVQMTAMLRETWGRWRLEPERFFDDGDRVVVFARVLAEGGASGVPVELETAHLWTIRDGRAASMHAYRDRTEALEAAGVSE